MMPPSRVTLLVPDLALLDAALAGEQPLSRALGGYVVAEGWEVFGSALPPARDALARDPESARWGARLFVLDESKTLAGWGGFKGPPDDGVVELGYAVAPGLRGRGVASDAVRQMLRGAFSHGDVRAVLAHTLAEIGPSTTVLEKTGFVHEGEGTDGKDGQLWRWRHDRPLQ